MKRRLPLLVTALPAVLGLLTWPWHGGFGIVGTLWRAYTLTAIFAVLLWATNLGLRWFLWRVGRRLALSYALVGVLPIPLAALLVVVGLYIGGGFVLGHLYRDAVQSVSADLRAAAGLSLERLLNERKPPENTLPFTFALYRDGMKLGGTLLAPPQWQSWWDDATSTTSLPSPSEGSFVAIDDGTPTLIATAQRGSYRLLAIYDGDLERELAERSGIWVELARSDEEQGSGAKRLRLLGTRELILKPPRLVDDRPEMADFFHPGNDSPSLFERPTLFWVEMTGSFRQLGTGEVAAKYVAATLTGNLVGIKYHLLARHPVFDTLATLSFLCLAYLLALVWILAMLTAVPLIFGLSGAVNALSDATERVQQGDFSARIAVRRRDQIGELQRSFNQMSANLESLIQSATQKELLEREVQMAREVQRSLLPDEMVADKSLRFATHFAPSAAIGGDYFDLLPLGEGNARLAVTVADVSGHGLSAGLRMAMVKSALQLLCEQGREPVEILTCLDRLQRSAGRGFVTAALAVIDRDSGEMTVTNAGHPPAYWLRAGRARELSPPGTPLGALGDSFGETSVQLAPGDVVLWLSDGLIEATDAVGEPFGYERVVAVLEGLMPQAVADAAVVRDAFLAAVAEHTGGRPPEDDQTLVVMAYKPRETAIV